jgi:hypothetical protein
MAETGPAIVATSSTAAVDGGRERPTVSPASDGGGSARPHVEHRSDVTVATAPQNKHCMEMWDGTRIIVPNCWFRKCRQIKDFASIDR